jgi:hypothetical protein
MSVLNPILPVSSSALSIIFTNCPALRGLPAPRIGLAPAQWPLTAVYLYETCRSLTGKVIRITQGVINILLQILPLFLCWWFHFNAWPFIAAVILFLGLLPYLLFKGRQLPAAVLRSCAMALVAYAFVNFELYPAILRYQAGTRAGRFIGTYQSGIAMPNADQGKEGSQAGPQRRSYIC